MDICFLSDVSVDDWIKIFIEKSVPVEAEPTTKTGATGQLWSVYVRDPDGNLIEISNPIV